MVVLLVAVVSLLCAPAALATITVNTTTDETVSGDGTCSLREAIAAANAHLSTPDCPGAAAIGAQSTIMLPGGDYHLTSGSELTITDSVAIIGASAANPAATTIDADQHDRVLSVYSTGQASLTDLVLTGGRTRDGGAGTPGATPGTPGGPGQSGGDGAGIYNLGTVVLSGVVITGNVTGSGGAGGTGFDCGSFGCTGPGAGGAGGSGGVGAGLYNAGVSATLSHVTITGNHSGDGGPGGQAGSSSAGGSTGGTGGSGGAGAGIFAFAPTVISDSTIAANTSGIGGAGGSGGFYFQASGTPGAGGAGGNGGTGAGIDYVGRGAVQVDASTISDNVTGGGGAGGPGGGSFSGGSDTGNGAAGGTGGSGGAGAGIAAAASSADTVQLTNTTIAGNHGGGGGPGGVGGVGAGSGQQAGTGGTGGSGASGGAIDDGGGELTLTAATVSGNSAGAGGAGGGAGTALGGASAGSAGTAGAAGTGGGLDSHGTGSTLTEIDSLLASNTGGNCAGAISDGGHDLSFPDVTCPHAVTGDPELGPLGDYGGPTQTIPLGIASTARDAVPPAGAACPSTDQRGVVRPQPTGGACDIGAYEYAPPVCRPVAVSARPGQPVTIALSCGDPSQLGLQYAIVKRPSHGRLGALNKLRGRITYTPKAMFTGTDTFTYTGFNANGRATPQTVRIKVTPAVLAISQARIVPSRFKAGAGAQLQFLLSAKALVQVIIARRVRSRWLPVGTLFAGRLRAGAHSLAIGRRVGGVRLRHGSYRATVLASSAGHRSKLVAVTFAILT